MSIISESVLKTLAIAGIVGAGTIAVDSVIDGAAKKAKEKKAIEAKADEVVEEQLVDDVESVQECKAIPKTVITVDSEKLKSILTAASYPAESVDAFVSKIKEEAKPDEEVVIAEILKNDEPKAPTFTVTKEEKKQPDLKAKTSNNNKKTNK